MSDPDHSKGVWPNTERQREQGWLQRELAAAKRDVEQLPEWLRADRPECVTVKISMTTAILDRMTGDEIVEWAYRFVGAADIERTS